MIVRGSMVYLVAGAVQRGLPFLLLPLYSRIFAPSEYGQIVVLTTTFGLITTVLSFGFESVLFRTYFDSTLPGDRDSRMAILLRFLSWAPLGVALVMCSALVLLRRPVAGVPAGILAVEVAAAAFNVGTTVGPLAILRAQERHADYAICSAAFVGILVTTQLTLVVVFERGVGGWALADLLTALLLRPFNKHRLRLQGRARGASPEVITAGLRIGVPLVPHFLGHWVLSLSDRFLVSSFLGAAKLGLYGAGYQLAAGLGIVFGEFNRATMPQYARAAGGSPDDLHSLRRLATMQGLIVVSVSASVTAAADPAVAVLLGPEYQASAGLIPAIALGFMFFGLYMIPMNCISLYARRTGSVWIVTLVAAASNLGLNLVLLPRVGLQGAAISTSLGYAVLFVGVLWFWRARVGGPLPVSWSPVALSAAVSAVIVGLCLRHIPAGSPGLLPKRLIALLPLWVVFALVTFSVVRCQGAARREAKPRNN